MALLRVLLGFASAPDHELEETAGHILTSLYGNAVFPTPPVTAANLQAALTAFTDAIAAQSQGGTAATAAKNQAAQTLIGLLRQLALYVQTTIQSNPAYGLAELLSSGFDAASTSRTQTPLATPTIIGIDNSGTGQLTLRVTPVSNARLYEAQSQTAPNAATGAGAVGEWTSAGMYQSTRGMAVTGLIPGGTYNFRVRAVGGSTGYSEWSNPVGHMSL